MKCKSNGKVLRCNISDSVKCTQCGRVSVVADLNFKPGATIPKRDGKGGYWQQTLYTCPCDTLWKDIKVIDPGEGNLVVAHLAKVELIEPDAPTIQDESIEPPQSIEPPAV